MSSRSPALAPSGRSLFARVATAAAAGALLLAGCTPADPGSDSDPSDGGGEETGSAADYDGPPLVELGQAASTDLDTDPATDPAYAAYYEQDLAWEDCEDSTDMDCATVTVPLRWDDPSAGDIDLAIARQPALDDAEGTLFINPGGPGGSGVDYAESARMLFTRDLQGPYDIVGFDPRGVSRSEGFFCLSDEETDEMRSLELDLETVEGEEDSDEWNERIISGCEESAGEILPYLDTYSAARDMDVLRAAVGEDQLDYLGYSYGTYLGASYAELYPERVGSFVLDGAMDPSLTLDELVDDQAAGFEDAIDAFLEDCLDHADSCPFRGTVEEAEEQLVGFFETTDENPLETSDPDRPLTGPLARSAVTMLLYQDELWELGRSALDSALSGDGTTLLYLADVGAGREDDGTYPNNTSWAQTAIMCLDRPSVADEDWHVEHSEQLAEEYPVLGGQLGSGGCLDWPEPPVRQAAPIRAEGAGPILVIGTTGDPATPLAWSEALADQLDSGVLLTFDGHGHTAYGRSGGCIEEAVDAFLIDDEVPEDGLAC